MKKIFLLLCIFAGIFIAGKYAWQEQTEIKNIQNDKLEVLLVYNHDRNESLGIRAFKSILEEEGVPFSTIDNNRLISMKPSHMVQKKLALIYPDGADSYINEDTGYWIKNYLELGGKVLAVYDVGTKTMKGEYRLSSSVLDDVLGIKTNIYYEKKKQAFLDGSLSFINKKTASYFGIPKGKYDENGTLVGYKYGALTYPYANAVIVNKDNLKIYAWGKGKAGNKIPIIARKQRGKGEILYVNLPLAYLKGQSDDLMARAVLRTFLFKMVTVPHIVSSPNAKGGIVINWHIDSNIELTVQPWFIAKGYITPKLRYSIDITAGPDCNKIGDGEGFDALGKGKTIVQTLMQYGIIGSHGGWAHNWFADNIETHKFTREEYKKYIQKNNEALSKITGYPMKEYAAPVGVYPQPASTEILGSLSMESYYYPGDTGSAPNRTFYAGKKISDTVIAFPVMSFGKNASLAEFEWAHYSHKKTGALLKDLVDYTIQNKTVRLYYSHPYDIYEGTYKKEVKDFIDYCVKNKEEGKLTVETMSYFRDFLLRVISTKKAFVLDDKGLHISLKTDKNLKEMVLAIPKRYVKQRSDILTHKVDQDDTYYYISADTNTSTLSMDIERE